MKVLFYVSAFLFCSIIGIADFHPSQADLNHDGKVDLEDLALFASAWMWESDCETAVTAQADTSYAGTTESSYWYSFTPSKSIAYMVSLCDGADGYTVSIYDGCDGALLGSSGDACWCVVYLAAGDEYLIKVEKSAATTDGDASVSYSLYITEAGE